MEKRCHSTERAHALYKERPVDKRCFRGRLLISILNLLHGPSTAGLTNRMHVLCFCAEVPPRLSTLFAIGDPPSWRGVPNNLLLVRRRQTHAHNAYKRGLRTSHPDLICISDGENDPVIRVPLRGGYS